MEGHVSSASHSRGASRFPCNTVIYEDKSIWCRGCNICREKMQIPSSLRFLSCSSCCQTEDTAVIRFPRCLVFCRNFCCFPSFPVLLSLHWVCIPIFVLFQKLTRRWKIFLKCLPITQTCALGNHIIPADSLPATSITCGIYSAPMDKATRRITTEGGYPSMLIDEANAVGDYCQWMRS